ICQALTITGWRALVKLDAQNRLRRPISGDSDQSRPPNLRMLIEHGFARDRKKCSARSNHTLRFSATKPDPAPVVERAQVAHAVKNAACLRIVDFRMFGGLLPMNIFLCYHRAADHDVTDLR